MYTVFDFICEVIRLRIGNIEIKGKAALAPMAGVADRAFRKICMDFGAACVVGEMVSAKGVTYGDRKSAELLELDDDIRPAAIQLFGDDPAIMAEAAKRALEFHPDWIDINMGCPAPKIAGNHCGSALMRESDLCRQLVQAVKDAVPIPVTAKIRKGYSKDEVNAVEVALACEAGGADAITVHGRTRDQMYAPPVDWDIIRQVKHAVHVPVIGNGDVVDAKSAAALYEQTDCDLIMVGRGALGEPWIFQQIEAYLNHEVLLPDPGMAQRMATLMKQVQLMVPYKGERVALLEARKHTAWYLSGMRGAAQLRREAGSLSSMEDLLRLCARVIQMEEEGVL